MIRSALLLCAGLLALSCFACAPLPLIAPPPPPAPVPTAMAVPPGPVVARLDCVGRSFADNVLLLDNATFHGPDAVDANYTAPVGFALADNDHTRAIKQDLQRAYNLAPQFFKNQLCGLDGIFVDSARPYSWGYRENKDNQHDNPQRRYIGLSENLWQGNNHAPLFTVYETGILNTLLGAPMPYYNFADPDTPEMTILGILAHEMGHILWWDRIISPDKARTFVCENPPPSGKQMFHKHSWFRIKNTTQYPQFHYLGLDIREDVPYNLPVRDDVQQDILSNKSQVPGDIAQIYGGEWASLFATISADEDFVETYKLLVLTSGPSPALTELYITPAPGYGSIRFIPEVISDANAPVVRKIQWMRRCHIQEPL